MDADFSWRGSTVRCDQGRIVEGQLLRPTAPGLGLTLTPEMEARYPFDETAVYSCALIDFGPPPDSYWARETGVQGA
ncbi:hypothetical protein [Nioella ostreopsis]|uniref:hypothetical protein n=1 Tax=Nioella ostreopsis TaxID=2448479 RepID=UPI000FD86775|nr:hypothetical protein [Nioella ostreopsis]